jgi:DNA ligase-1
MKRFTQLYRELDQTNRLLEKVAALERYFREAPPADAAWALYFLSGNRLSRVVPRGLLARWAAEESHLPAFLIEECYHAVGDFGETVALLLPNEGPGTSLPLHQLMEQRVDAMRDMPEQWKREVLVRTWREFNSLERLVWNKLITGSFRVGVARTLVVRALANVAGVEQAVMAHRVLGKWQPTAEDFMRILRPEGTSSPAQPYPFFLASPLQTAAAEFGPLAEWQVEWKWDGIRAQLIRREAQSILWSRGDEIVTDAFPEIADSSRLVPEGTVLDGEILAWEGERVLPFARLQRRLGRRKVGISTLRQHPVVFLAYDLLEWGGKDFRGEPLSERRPVLEALHRRLGASLSIKLSPVISAQSWEELASLQRESRERGVEGLMLKRLNSAYGVGRQRGDWWKWKIDPYLIDAVLIYAQPGSGRRASVFTDYTFGLWQEGKLVPVAKAYSGLTDAEIKEVDAFVRRNTLDKFGPVRVVKPELVFELAFEGIQESTRHKAGIAVRFPRMNRWRRDKKAEEADTVEALRGLLRGEKRVE